jgi:NADP-dependent 3-hydroxy acid dehydrogenase YdfG
LILFRLQNYKKIWEDGAAAAKFSLFTFHFSLFFVSLQPQSNFSQHQNMNKTVFITGATSGIGLGCAYKFAANGDRLILNGRNVKKLETIRQELQAKGTEVIVLAFDVRDREAARKAIERLPEEWQSIDVLVNNAGLALGLEPEYEGDLDDWETMIDTNIKGLLTMTRLIVPQMIARDSGHIINIGSVAGDAAYAGGNVYCATKAAVKALSDGLRIDVANTSVRVTNLKPGLVETNFSNIRFHGDTDRAAKLYQGIKPLTGDDIADVAVYAANAPAHVQIAEVLILATHQASGSVIVRK